MSELSVIITEVLRELYTAHPKHDQDVQQSSLPDLHMRNLSNKINSLDGKLRHWYRNVHSELHLENAEAKQRAYTSAEEMSKDIGGSGERFELHVLRMQAVTLKLAFENAIIMTHRPFLSFRSATMFKSRPGQAEIEENPYKSSIARCRMAALNTAEIGSYSAFDEALDTYAASFIGIHIFTAGVVLCLIASFEPMTSQAHEAKVGIQKLMSMQRKLQGRSTIAAQGVNILEKVVALVIDKELQEVLGHGRTNLPTSSRQNDEVANSGNTQTTSNTAATLTPSTMHSDNAECGEVDTREYNANVTESCLTQPESLDPYQSQYQMGTDSST